MNFKNLAAISISSLLMISTFACNSGGADTTSLLNNVTGSANNTDSSITKPTFSLGSGTYLRGEELTITAPIGMKVNITTDGSAPTSTHYTFSAMSQTLTHGAAGSMTVKAVTLNATTNKISDIVSNDYVYIADPDAVAETTPIVQQDYNYNPAMNSSANYFSFTPSTTKGYVFDACNSATATTGANLALYSDAGFTTAVAGASDIFDTVVGTHFMTSLTASTPYYLKASPQGAIVVPSYLLRIIDVTGLAGNINVPDAVSDYGLGSQSLAACDRNFYKFTAKAGISYTIYTKAATNVDTILAQYKSDLSAVERTDDNTAFNTTCTTCSSIDVPVQSATEDKVIYFMVKPKSETAISNYSIFVGEY